MNQEMTMKAECIKKLQRDLADYKRGFVHAQIGRQREFDASGAYLKGYREAKRNV